MHVAKAWNAIIAIAAQHHSHLIRNHYSEADLEKRVKKCWDSICDNMEHKETGIKKSVILTKFSSAKLIDTGKFCADVIKFRDELNRWKLEAEGLGIQIDGEMAKTHFKLGLPPTHQNKSIRDIFRRYDDKDGDEFHAHVINDLHEEEIYNEVQESLIPSTKLEARVLEIQKEITDPHILKANIADMQRKLALYGRGQQTFSKFKKFKAPQDNQVYIQGHRQAAQIHRQVPHLWQSGAQVS